MQLHTTDKKRIYFWGLESKKILINPDNCEFSLVNKHTVKVCLRTKRPFKEIENISYFLVEGQFELHFKQNIQQFPVLNFAISNSPSDLSTSLISVH